MVSLIFLIIDIEILVILPYISTYFITLELYIRLSNTQILILGTMALFKITIIIIIIMTTTTTLIRITMMISTAIFQNINEKLEKMIYFVFTILGVLLPPKVLYVTHR